MIYLKKIYFLLLLLFSLPAVCQNLDSLSKIYTLKIVLPADSSAKLSIHQIRITGNKKTKLPVILREIQFLPGDSILSYKLLKEIELARQQVYNTTLFNTVLIEPLQISSSQVDILVTVKERWYIYPLPQFQPVDRNLNEWLVKYRADFSRIKYGVKFVDYNLTGNRDVLKIYLLNGYTRNISFTYAQPFSSKALMEGFIFGAGYAQSREVGYQTTYNNNLLFYKNGNFVNDNFFITAGYSFRKAIKTRHFFNLSFTKASINDSIASIVYNPNYFKNGEVSKSFLDFSYTYRYANADNIIYPLKGETGFATISKRGFGFTGGINMFYVEGAFNKYINLKNNWFASMQLAGKIKLPFNQPYYNQKALGYGDATLRGLEYYVIDGAAYGIIKTTLKKKLLSFSVPLPFKSAYFNSIPFTFYAKTYADIGYAANNKKYDTYLNNKFLFTRGIGIDIVTLYDISFRFEYSFNQLGQKGLFLQAQGGF